jgi:hypothetical protein
VPARCSDLIDQFFYYEPLTLRVLKIFTGRQLATKEVKDNINHPCNAFNVEANAHGSYDKLASGIEAVLHGNEVNKHISIDNTPG